MTSHVTIVVQPTSGHAVLTPTGTKFTRLANGSFREAPLSTLDDTMSRIKGALDVMHSSHSEAGPSEGARSMASGSSPATSTSHSSSAAPTRQNRWLPPALRPQGADFKHRWTEVCANTSSEPPLSPSPSEGKPTIHLPKTCRSIPPVPKKQLIAFRSFNGPVRWEILSFDPPVEGMTKKSLSLNDVLF